MWKIIKLFANNGDPDQMLPSVASDLAETALFANYSFRSLQTPMC